MKRSRWSLATVALGVGVVACGSGAPLKEDTGTAASEATVHCPIGEAPSCKGAVCTCVPTGTTEPVPCALLSSVPASPPFTDYLAAWAAMPRNGLCTDIPGSGGVWAQLGTTPPSFSPLGQPNAVPTDTLELTTTCANVFNGVPCCTYVWWPTNLYTSDSPSMQDNSVVCTDSTRVYAAAIYQDSVATCILPGCKAGGDCSTCTGVTQ